MCVSWFFFKSSGLPTFVDLVSNRVYFFITSCVIWWICFSISQGPCCFCFRPFFIVGLAYPFLWLKLSSCNPCLLESQPLPSPHSPAPDLPIAPSHPSLPSLMLHLLLCPPPLLCPLISHALLTHRLVPLCLHFLDSLILTLGPTTNFSSCLPLLFHRVHLLLLFMILIW